jgi:hypothetical protein
MQGGGMDGQQPMPSADVAGMTQNGSPQTGGLPGRMMAAQPQVM